MTLDLNGFNNSPSLSGLEDYSSERLRGGAVSLAGRQLPSLTPNVTVSPTIFVAPLLRSSSSSFNFFGNRGSFNGDSNLILLS